MDVLISARFGFRTAYTKHDFDDSGMQSEGTTALTKIKKVGRERESISRACLLRFRLKMGSWNIALLFFSLSFNMEEVPKNRDYA